jgi:ABC-2 type transport system permease protein
MNLPLGSRDTVTMLRRNLTHQRRYPSLTLMLLAQPVLILLLFVFVFGQTLGAGVAPGLEGAGRSAYLDYVVPGILLFGLAGVGLGTAISMAADRTKGIQSRLRTMGIGRPAVLAGEVLGSTAQAAFVFVVVSATALLLGYRPGGSVGGWVGAFAVGLAVALALIWLCVAIGLNSRSVETASNTPLLLLMLLFLSSGFVPADSYPVGLRWFAEHQPFTTMIEAMRGLLDGTPDGPTILGALLWCTLLSAIGYAWARHLYEREPAPAIG